MSGLRVVLVVLALLGVALASGRAAGGAPTSSPPDTPGYDDCTSGCGFKIGIAYCKWYHDPDQPYQDTTGLDCYNMGRTYKLQCFTGRCVIRHRGWAEITTGDSNKVVLFRYEYFSSPGHLPLSRFVALSSFHWGDYDCIRYGDGARCTVPSPRYPGTLLAIFLTKRGGVWYRRIPG